MTYTKIENTEEARKAPLDKYRLLLNGQTEEYPGLYHVRDFDRAELALLAADELTSPSKGDGWAIVHDSNGRILTPDDGPSQMYTHKELLKTYGERASRGSGRAFTTQHADAIEALQPERLPGWQKGDRMLVFWQDIVDATGAVAYFGDIHGEIGG